MKNNFKKSNSEKLIEQIIDASAKYSKKRTASLKSEAMVGIKAMVELLFRFDNVAVNPVKIKTKVTDKKTNYAERLMRIRELRESNMRLYDIGKQLRSEGYTISDSLISTLLARHRKTANIKIPESLNLGQAISYLRGNGYTYKMIVNRLNEDGYRTHKRDLLTENNIHNYFAIPEEERVRDYKYDVYSRVLHSKDNKTFEFGSGN